MFTRYAIYVTPAPARPLAAFGAAWLGWDSAARVDFDQNVVAGVAVKILDTRAAFAEYNRILESGRRVALLAHTTC